MSHLMNLSLKRKKVKRVCGEIFKILVNADIFQVTLCKIGDHCVVDPTSAEEQCSQGAVVVAISKGKFSTILQTGAGSLHPLTLVEKLKLGAKLGSRLDEALSETLSKVKKDSEMGFLH